jgi:hypothetical protein
MVAVTAFVRGDVPPAENPSWYWRCKVEWRERAHAILAGNSRIYRGLDPSAFEKALGPGKIALNAGFSSTVWSKSYLDYLEQALIQGRTACIVLGIDPNSLVRPFYRPGGAYEETGFGQALEDAAKTRIPADWEARWGSVFRRLRPFPLAASSEKTEENYLQKFHSNGWVESDYVRPDLGSYIRETRKRLPEISPVDPETLERLTERIRKWRHQGIEVLGFRPPTTRETDLFEDEIFRFDEREVAESVRSAGGCWVVLSEKEGFFSYDGSHLNPDSARRLSRSLAVSLKQCLERNAQDSAG